MENNFYISRAKDWLSDPKTRNRAVARISANVAGMALNKNFGEDFKPSQDKQAYFDWWKNYRAENNI